MTTLDDLRRATSEYQKAKHAYESNASLGWDIAEARADAWRTAFEWRDGLVLSDGENDAEHEEGIRLIREHLR